MGDGGFTYGTAIRGNNGDLESGEKKPPEEQPDKPAGKDLSQDAVIVKIEDPVRPKTMRQHRGHVRTGSSVDDHPPLYAKDSAYLISERSPSRQRQLLVENCGAVIVAVLLCILGVGLVVTGIVVESMSLEHLRSMVFYIAGAICLIPGVYHIVYIYCALKGKQGYNLANLPVFNWT